MTRYYALTLATKYWLPKSDFIDEIIKTVTFRVSDGDFLVISEKAISTAKGNVVDESTFVPSLTAKFLSKVWMPIIWGYFLGFECHFGQRLLRRLRSYPYEAGSRHKQVAIEQAGFFQALMFGSEGGIDGSNLPYSLVSLPLKTAAADAEEIRNKVSRVLSKHITVIIVDTDKTYSFHNFHLTARPMPMRGICSHGNLVAYLVGRILKLKKRPTPLAVAGNELHIEDALTIANVADRARGPGSGATVWDMAARFKVPETEVTWEMLGSIRHKPIVIVRRAIKRKSLQHL